jgi:hypothetical protein
MWPFGESVLARLLWTAHFGDASVFVGCSAHPGVVEFSAAVEANCQWCVSSDALEIYFHFVRIDLVSVALACLLKSIRAGQHAIGAGGDQVLLSPCAVLLEKTVNKSNGQVFVFEWECPHFSGCCVDDKKIAFFASLTLHNMVA